MQSRPVARLAARIRKMRASRHPKSYRAICLKLGILKADGEPDPAMAWLIGNADFEPVMPATRARLGLPKVCRECHRSIRAGHSHPARQPSPARRWWNGLSDEERERIFRKEGMK